MAIVTIQVHIQRWASRKLPPFWNTRTTNNLYGVQIGVDAKMLELGRFSLHGLMKTGIFDNNAQQSTGVSLEKVVYPSQATTNHAAFDTFILALDPVVIPDPIFGHGPISPRSIDRRISPCVASVVTLRELASLNLHRS